MCTQYVFVYNVCICVHRIYKYTQFVYVYTLCISVHSMYKYTPYVYVFTSCISVHSMFMCTHYVYVYTVCICVHSMYVNTVCICSCCSVRIYPWKSLNVSHVVARSCSQGQGKLRGLQRMARQKGRGEEEPRSRTQTRCVHNSY